MTRSSDPLESGRLRAPTDTRQRFLFEYANVRGELIRLDAALLDLLARCSYPPVVARQLGEAMAAAGLLSSTLKFEGALILQLRGDGVLRTLVASANHDRDLRAVARLDEARSLPEPADGGPSAALAPLSALTGEGYLAITIDPEGEGERWQGVVSLTGEHLADSIEAYFAESEQLPTRLWLACDGRRAAGLLLQRLPGHDHGDADAWDRAQHLAATITAEELLGLSAQEVLRRLFHEEIIRVFEPQAMRFHCHCSRERLGRAVLAMGREDARSVIAEQGQLEGQCGFCGQLYYFDAVDVEQLFQHGGTDQGGATRH
jgi:molecular chaperone Hsp33